MTLDEFKEYTKKVIEESNSNELEFHQTYNKMLDIAEKQRDLVDEWYDVLTETEEETEFPYGELYDMGDGIHWLPSQYAC